MCLIPVAPSKGDQWSSQTRTSESQGTWSCICLTSMIHILRCRRPDEVVPLWQFGKQYIQIHIIRHFTID
ncbi:hypothetical protein FKM82_017721 [Ascaphus truei]